MTEKQPRTSGEEGFTLIEALIAIVILIFGLAAIANLYAVAGGSNSAANQGTAAVTIAAERMEMLKATPYNELVDGGSLDSDQGTYFSDTQMPGVGTIHTRWLIRRVSGDNQVIYVAVRSEGSGAFGGPRSRAEFTAFRACTGLALGCPAR
jgi:type II secretory pathway pseudopilin PulG